MSPAIAGPDLSLLARLLQLAGRRLSPGVGGPGASLEPAVCAGRVHDARSLKEWLIDGLFEGSARLEASVLVRVYDAIRNGDRAWAGRWDDWLTAVRETELLRARSLAMGHQLVRLLVDLEPGVQEARAWLARSCNLATAFAIAAGDWAIPRAAAAAAYLQCWARDLVSAGIKLVPLGQSAGQQLLWELQVPVREASALVAGAPEDLDLANRGPSPTSTGLESRYAASPRR